MQIKTFVINLDRRPDRLAFMSDQLDGLELDWQRVSALDKDIATDAEIAAEVKLSGHRVRMGRGSQCCAITNFNIFQHVVEHNLPGALILQDDVELSPQILPFLHDLSWLPSEIGLVQFEKFGRQNSTRLCTPVGGDMPVPGRRLLRLHSRTGGAGCFLMTRWAAEICLAEKPILDMPIDHFLFSPNVSPLFHRLGVAIVAPALAQQKMDEIASDIAAERQRDKTITQHLRRLGQDLNQVPMQLIKLVLGARWMDFGYAEQTDREHDPG